MGCICGRIEGVLKPVIVGGFALEWYTGGGYSTSDIDVVYPNPERIGELLEGIGFTKVNRHWVSIQYDMQIEVPHHALDGVVLDHAMTIEIEGRQVLMIGIEDLIVDRLRRCVHAGSTGDSHWATSLLAAYDKNLDQQHLDSRAMFERVEEALLQARRQAESISHDAADRELR